VPPIEKLERHAKSNTKKVVQKIQGIEDYGVTLEKLDKRSGFRRAIKA